MKQLTIICLSIILISCHDIERPKKPKDLLSKDKMVEVIIDMALLTSAKGSNKFELQENGIIPKEYILEKHGVDSIRFAKSNEYYSFDVKVYETIYQRVNDSLQALKTKYTTLDEEGKMEKRTTDSIKKTNVLNSTKLKEELPKRNLNKPLSKTPDSLR
ncbi:MAG TPA: DUF4296 domain-containing protein [Flavobacteriaceae bacterium]|nr:DUF4296 domain-containing protein [Flavobacteriaceae bacterium]